MTPLAHLKQLIIEEKKRNNPDMPERYFYADTFENFSPEKREKKRICKFLELMGWEASIIENRGQRKSTKTTVYWDEGVGREIGTVTWQKSGMRRGLSDVTSTIKGKSVKIELKRIYKKGKDRQSDEQKEYQQLIEKAGGVYVITSGYNEFYEWYKNNIDKI